jgi:tetratricopeptide (TPR) repeat protein
MSVLVPLIIALVPLIITPGALANFDITPKIALLLAVAALMLLQPRTNLSNLRALASGKAGKWLLVVLAAEWAAFAIATVFSFHPVLSLDGGSWRRLGLIPQTGLLVFAALAAGWMSTSKDHVRWVLGASTTSGALAACYGIAQYFGRDPWLPAAAYQVGEGVFTIVRPPGTLGHADYFAAWLVVAMFLALALRQVEESRLVRTLAASAAALDALAILLSGTRAALLGAAAGAFVLLLARRKRIGKRAIVASALCSASVLALFLSPAGLKLRARLHWSIEDARGGARLLLWRDSLAMAAHRPVAGFGPETFATEFPRFESMGLASAYPDFYHESPHNIWLDALTSQGMLGLLALIALCGLGTWSAVRACRDGTLLGSALAAALAGFIVTQQFTVFVFTTELYFYLVIGLLVVSVGSPRKAVKPARWPVWLLVAPALLATVLVVYSVRLLVADRALARADKRTASGDIPRAAALYTTAMRWQPPPLTSDLDYSRAMRLAAARAPMFSERLLARQEALNAGVRAVRNAEDRQNAWYNLAMLLADQNDAQGVERALRNAIAWAPHWFKPHWELARLLALSGRYNEATAEARTAMECDGNHDEEVAATWKQLQSRPH